MVADLRKRKIISEHIARGRSIIKIDTNRALKELEDVMYLIVDNQYNSPRTFYDTARHLILDWLYQLAAKSETDLLLVIELFEKSKEKMLQSIPNAVEFNWYINRAFENFRGSDKTTYSIFEIKKILQSIEM
ncbi:MAG TPA: hypothetical protein VK666_04115 [Chryseolinea sp.]|nr:hypothetical protein [Chryseolinea sp.]